MKTSKEMQIEALRRIIDNIENDREQADGIEMLIHEDWIPSYLNMYPMRVKPQTITINGVEIPKPLSCSGILSDGDYYYVENNEFLHDMSNGTYIKLQGIRFVYRTKQEAIEASKALFGIED